MLDWSVCLCYAINMRYIRMCNVESKIYKCVLNLLPLPFDRRWLMKLDSNNVFEIRFYRIFCDRQKIGNVDVWLVVGYAMTCALFYPGTRIFKSIQTVQMRCHWRWPMPRRKSMTETICLNLLHYSVRFATSNMKQKKKRFDLKTPNWI